MNVLHEITMMLSAKAASSNASVFKSTSKSIDGIKNRLDEINRQKVKADKYADLSESTKNAKKKLEELKNSESDLKNKLSKTDSEIRSQTSAVKQAEETYLSYKLKLDGVSKVSEAQRQEKKKLKQIYDEEKKSLAGLKGESKDYAKELENVRKEANYTNKQLNLQESQMQKLDEELKDAKFDTGKLAEEQKKLSDAYQKATDKQKKFDKTLESKNGARSATVAYGGLATASAGLVAAMGAPTKKAMSFESAMADVKKVVDFDNPKQFKQMGKDIMELTSTKIPMLKEDMASIVAAGGQSGIDDSELLAYAESAAKMGIAFDIAAEDAGETMAQWRSAFKMNQKEVNDLADKINLLGNETASSAPAISDVVKRIGPLGEVGGVASGSIAALGATMISSGVESEVAATGIKNMILNLTKGETATDKQKEAFKKLGTSSTEMAKAMQNDSEAAITGILEKIKGLSKEEQISTLNTLFGSESVASVSTLFTNLDELKKNMWYVGDATQYAGSMEAEFTARANTTENSTQLMKNSLDSLGTTFGEMFLPAVKSSSKFVTNLSNKLRHWIDLNPKIAKGLGYVVAGGAVLSTTIFGLCAAVSASKWAFFTAKGAIMGWNLASKAGAAIQLVQKGVMLGSSAVMGLWTLATGGATTAMGLLNAVMLANPIGLVVIAVAGLIAALVIAYKKSERFRNVCNGIKDGIVFLIEAGFSPMINRIKAFKELLSKVKVPGWIKTLGKAVEKGWNFVTGGGNTTTVTTTTKPKGKGYVKPVHLASGGIATKPTFAEIGEGGEPEVVAPLSKLGTMVKGFNDTKEGNNGSKIEYKPTYVFQGGSPSKKDLVEAEHMSQSKFNKMMQQYERDKRRTKFAPA